MHHLPEKPDPAEGRAEEPWRPGSISSNVRVSQGLKETPRSPQQGSCGVSLSLLYFFLSLSFCPQPLSLFTAQQEDSSTHSQTPSGDPALHLTCEADKAQASQRPRNETDVGNDTGQRSWDSGLLNYAWVSLSATFLLFFLLILWSLHYVSFL